MVDYIHFGVSFLWTQSLLWSELLPDTRHAFFMGAEAHIFVVAILAFYFSFIFVLFGSTSIVLWIWRELFNFSHDQLFDLFFPFCHCSIPNICNLTRRSRQATKIISASKWGQLALACLSILRNYNTNRQSISYLNFFSIYTLWWLVLLRTSATNCTVAPDAGLVFSFNV